MFSLLSCYRVLMIYGLVGCLAFASSFPEPISIHPTGALLEFNAQENLFSHAQFIVQSSYHKPEREFSIVPETWIDELEPRLTSELSQRCLLQVDPPSKTSCYLNTGFGYSIKEYQMFLLTEGHSVYRIKPSFLLPFTMSVHSSLKGWQSHSLMNVEVEIDPYHIRRDVSMEHHFIGMETTVGVTNLSLFGTHSEYLTSAFRSEPFLSLGFSLTSTFK